MWWTMRLSPRDFLAGRILMLGFLLVLLSRDLFNLFFVPPAQPGLLLSLVLVGAVCASCAWFWLRIAGTGDARRATAALAVLTASVVGYTLLDPDRSYPYYYPFYYCAMVAGAAYPWRAGIAATTAVAGLGAAVVARAHGRDIVLIDLVLVMLLLGLAAVGVRRHVASALAAGATGFILKDSSARELAVAIRRVAAGERVLDPRLAVSAIEQGDNPLTPREREVLQLSGEGQTAGEVARRLAIAEGTVRNHLSVAIQKLHARGKVEAAQQAQRRGWL
jgi:DNA-binding CsgD family transcriptional regulator